MTGNRAQRTPCRSTLMRGLNFHGPDLEIVSRCGGKGVPEEFPQPPRALERKRGLKLYRCGVICNTGGRMTNEFNCSPFLVCIRWVTSESGRQEDWAMRWNCHSCGGVPWAAVLSSRITTITKLQQPAPTSIGDIWISEARMRNTVSLESTSQRFKFLSLCSNFISSSPFGFLIILCTWCYLSILWAAFWYHIEHSSHSNPKILCMYQPHPQKGYIYTIIYRYLQLHRCGAKEPPVHSESCGQAEASPSSGASPWSWSGRRGTNFGDRWYGEQDLCKSFGVGPKCQIIKIWVDEFGMIWKEVIYNNNQLMPTVSLLTCCFADLPGDPGAGGAPEGVQSYWSRSRKMAWWKACQTLRKISGWGAFLPFRSLFS